MGPGRRTPRGHVPHADGAVVAARDEGFRRQPRAAARGLAVREDHAALHVGPGPRARAGPEARRRVRRDRHQERLVAARRAAEGQPEHGPLVAREHRRLPQRVGLRQAPVLAAAADAQHVDVAVAAAARDQPAVARRRAPEGPAAELARGHDLAHVVRRRREGRVHPLAGGLGAAGRAEAAEEARTLPLLGGDDRLRGAGLDVPQARLDVAGRRVQDVAAVGELHMASWDPTLGGPRSLPGRSACFVFCACPRGY
mmetsp:Transcript_24078/g.72258  ORF Transcript_24078/g.72258 Transcript_24078/m.72258 type:complete len:255 (+) Transcript_24078:628-1392(+)